MQLIDEFLKILPEFRSAGWQMLQELWAGLKEKWAEVKQWVGEKVDWLTDKLMFWRSGQDEMAGRSGFSDAPRISGSHAAGLPYVPYDGYIAQLHRGETVLSADSTNDLVSRIGDMMAQVVNAIGTVGGGGGGQPMQINLVTRDGMVLARWLIDYLRSVDKSSPEVVSDL